MKTIHGKRWLALLVTAVLLAALACPAFASGNAEAVTKVGLTSHTILPGQTMFYHASGGSGFPLRKGMPVSLTASAEASTCISWRCGYQGTEMNSGTLATISGSARCPSDRDYKFFIENTSSEPLNIVSGEIYCG